MEPLIQTKFQSLMEASEGDPNITIGLIDGPIDLSHPDFERSRIRSVKESHVEACKNASGIACLHGTLVSGILSAKRGSFAPAICPGCTLLSRPIFIDKLQSKSNNYYNKKIKDDNVPFPYSNPEELSDAIVEIINKGARIINLSLGLSGSTFVKYPALQEAYEYACKKGVIIVAAAGNHGNIGSISLIESEWIIPVTACNEYGRFAPMSNFGPSIGSRGLMAPGINITSTMPGGGYIKVSGTSFAAPFVTGAIALLWSIFPDMSAAQLIYSIRIGSLAKKHSRSIMPPLLNVEAVYNLLKNMASKRYK